MRYAGIAEIEEYFERPISELRVQLPKPLAVLQQGPIWNLDDVERRLFHPERPGGRVYLRKDGRWQVNVTVEGKRVYRYARTQREAEHMLEELQRVRKRRPNREGNIARHPNGGWTISIRTKDRKVAKYARTYEEAERIRQEIAAEFAR